MIQGKSTMLIMFAMTLCVLRAGDVDFEGFEAIGDGVFLNTHAVQRVFW